MVGFVAVAKTFQDVNGVWKRRLVYLYRLETTSKRCVFFKVLAVLIQSGCTDCLQLSTSKHRFQNRSCVDCTLSSTCANQGVDLIDESDDVATGTNFLGDFLKSFFEVSAVAATCNKGTKIKCVELFVLQGFWHVAGNNCLRKTFNNCSFSYAWFTNQDRVVF